MEFAVRTRSGGEEQHEEEERMPDSLVGILGFSFEEQAPVDYGCLLFWIFSFSAERKERPLSASRERIRLDPGEEESIMAERDRAETDPWKNT